MRRWKPDGCDCKLRKGFRKRKFGWTLKVFTKTGTVLGNAYHVGIYLLAVDMKRQHRGLKYVLGQQ